MVYVCVEFISRYLEFLLAKERCFGSPGFFTGENCNCMPLPAGLSGAVITPTTSKPASNIACNDATAKSGVPKKTTLIQKSLWSGNIHFL